MTDTLHQNPPEKSHVTLPEGTVAGSVLVKLSSAVRADEKSSNFKMKIAPRGKVATRDGRSYNFDPEKLVARFEADGIDIPVDIDHSISKRAMFGEQADAVGWIKSLSAEDDGLYGQVEFLDAGIEVLVSKTHRFVSPTFTHDQFNEAEWLHSAALVAAPALAMPAIASAQPGQADDPSSPTEKPMNKIAEFLGLNTDANETACLSALTDLRDGMVDKKVHDETLAQLSATTTELITLKSEVRKDKVNSLLDTALKEKKILPAQRDHYEALCATDEGMAQVEELIKASPAALGASGLDDKTTTTGPVEIDPAALAAKATAYQKQQAEAGVTIQYNDAVNAVKAQLEGEKK